jgi:hypothetical protein
MDLVSATQITLFGECPRKWGWRYIARIETPQNASAALGTEVDDTQLQPYLRDDRPLDFSRTSGYISAPGLAFLPKPKSNALEVQKHFTIPSPSFREDGKHIGFGYQGLVDLWLPSGGMPDIPPLQDGTVAPVVCDFKTTSNFRYQKTATQLETDVQAQLYATWAMYQTKSRVVDLVWIYFATKGPRKAKRTHLRVLAPHVAEQFSKINDTALSMYAVRKSVTDPLELPPNVDMCEQYGGCPYRDKCNLSPGQIIDAKAAQWVRKMEAPVANTTQGTGTVSLLEKLRAKKAGQVAPAAPAPTVDAGPEALPAWATSAVDPRNVASATTYVGINPPESQLAPAPPVGSVAPGAVKTEAQIVADGPQTTTARRGPGRSPKKTQDPIGADVAAHTSPAEPPITTTPGPATDITPAEQPTSYLAGNAVTVTWAEETLCPVPYNSFKVGPFQVTGRVRVGETIPQACGRLYYELAAFAEQAREAKAASFAALLRTAGGK